MITGINESKTLTKHISCKCKCRFDGGIAINVNVKVKELMHMKKTMFGILLNVIVKTENV